METDLSRRIERGARWIAASQRLVVFSGAGISTDSGVPDFRGPDGVWTRQDKGLPPPAMKVPFDEVRPNAGHLAVVELQSMGKLSFLISQNVDDLHRQSGIDPESMAELHGNRNLMKCLACDKRFAKSAVNWEERKWGQGRRAEAPVAGQPDCPACGGRLISSVVHFGDPMPAKEMELSLDHALKCDLFIVVGSSLVVSPANTLPECALRAGAKLILINRGRTPFDHRAHLRFEEGIGVVLPPMVARAREFIEEGTST